MCKNCGVTNSEDLFGLYEKMKRCMKCTRRLADSLFIDDQSTICKTCKKKNVSTTVDRSAFNGAMRELKIDIKGDVEDLEAVIDNSRHRISQNLQKTIEENKCV